MSDPYGYHTYHAYPVRQVRYVRVRLWVFVVMSLLSVLGSMVVFLMLFGA